MSAKSRNSIVRFDEATEALFAEVRQLRAEIEQGSKPNRRHLLRVAEQMGEHLGSAGIEVADSLFALISEHLASGKANASMVVEAMAGLLELHDEKAALHYLQDLINERLTEIEFLRALPVREDGEE